MATLIASEFGGGAMLAASGLGYSSGWGVMWYVGPFAIGALLFAFLLAERLNEEGRKYRCISFVDWLSARHGGEHVGIRLVVGLVMVLGLAGGTAGQIIATGTVLNGIADVPFIVGLSVGGLILIAYATLGGLYSVVWTDLFQFILFVLAMVIILPLAIIKAGGIDAIEVATPPEYWTLFPKGMKWHITMLVTMLCAPFVRQYYYQRMFAAKSPKTAKRDCTMKLLP